MEIEEWKEHLNKAKKSNKMTGQSRPEVNFVGDKVFLKQEEKCSQCGVEKEYRITVHFKENPKYIRKHSNMKLSIFEAGILMDIFGKKKIPKDYAGYHESPAGERFIENIENVNVVRDTYITEEVKT